MRASLSTVLLLALFLLVLLGCDERKADEAVPAGFAAETRVPSDPPAPIERVSIEPLDVGPVTFFNDACARCHGEFGWGYEDGFTEKYTRDELKKVVREMVVGPSQRTLGERELEALTDLHYAIDAGDEGLFLAVTEWGAELKGETLPGTTVLASSHNEEIPGGTSTTAGVEANGRWTVSDFDPDRPRSLWSYRCLEDVTSGTRVHDGRVYPMNVKESVALFDLQINWFDGRITTVDVLSDRGAWVALGPSGRIFGEKDSGE